MSGIRTIAEILVIFQSFMCVMVALTSCFPTRNLHEVHIRSAPNWSINPNEKRCLDFCVYVNCNFGTCHQDPKNCGLSCTCQDGYYGRRCTKKISTETTSVSIVNITPQWPISHIVNTTLLKPQHTPDIVRRRLENAKGEDNHTDGIGEFGKTLSEGKSEDSQNITPNPLIFQETVSSDIVSTIAGLVAGTTKSTSLSSVSPVSANNADDNITQTPNDLSTQLQTSSTLLSKTESFGKVFIPNNGLSSMKFVESKVNESEITNSNNITKWNYTSKYLDNCKAHCYEGVCIPDENKSKFQCLPKNHGCQKGFQCYYGVCQITSGFTQVICICEPGWIGDFCRARCDLKCERGGCFVSKGVQRCICPEGRTGRNCERLMPKEKGKSEKKWYWYVVGACAGVVVIFLVILITVPYCLWKKRWLFVMKIVHFFQDYEEDDGKEYDAFISYKSSKEDQDFVLRQLYPKLEQEMGFKLCMHFRDFTPGDVIANNIIRAIENSRRTIMILSPNYVDSEWCRMEYQKAQHEMLKRRHKIIPILFKDISEASNYDKNLDIILNTVTYIEWPGEDNAQKLERFWNQMRLSLPKKRANISSPSSPSPPTSTDTSSTISFSDPNVLSYTDSSPKAKVSSIVPTLAVSDSSKALSDQDTLENENSKGRLRKIVKDMLKLKIHSRSNSFVRLHREGSLESAPSTPSPGLCIDKDMNPLINRKRSNKSSTWSAKTLQHTLKPCARSHSEKNCSIKKLDVIQQSYGQRDELPDICKCSDESYINVVCNVSDQSYNITENDDDKNNSNEELSQNRSSIFDDKHDYESNISLKEDTSQSLSHQFHSCETCVFPKEVDNNKYKNVHDNNCETCIMNCETSNTQFDNNDNKYVNAISKDTGGRSFRLISKKKDIPRRYSDGENFNIYTSSYNKCQSKECGLHRYISDRNANNQCNGNAFLMDQNISVSEQDANTKEPCKTCVMTLNKDSNYNVNIDPDVNSNSNVSSDMNIEFNIHARCETKILNTAQGEYTPRGPSSGINRRLSAPNNCLSERPFIIPRRDKIRRESAPQTFNLVHDLEKKDVKSPQPVKRTLETVCDPPKPPKRTKRRKHLRK